MPFSEIEKIKTYKFESLAGEALVQVVFTRHGGVSQAPWASLNLGGTVGDNPVDVQENRRLAFQSIELSQERMYDVWQVHSDKVVITDKPRPAIQEHLKADAILTNRPGLALFMRFADCVPIFLFDPVQKAVGLVHAGWRGTVNQIAGRAVRTMQQIYGTRPQDVLAGIGPSIGPHHYEVGKEVIEQVQQSFGSDAAGLLQTSSTNGHGVKLDLWSANHLVLERSGVRQVELSGICTACHLDDWYSHRGEAGRTGRFGAVIQLTD